MAKAAAYDEVHIAINDEIISSRTAHEILAVSDRRLQEFNPINVATAIHRIAKRPDVSMIQEEAALMPLLQAFVTPLRDVGLDNPQDLSHTVWAFAKILFVDEPLCTSISTASLRSLHEFEAWHIASMVWSFAELLRMDIPLSDSIAAKASIALHNWDPLDIACTAWAFAKIGMPH